MLYVHITSLKCTNRERPPPPLPGTERYEPIVTYATSLAGLSIIISMTTQPLSMCHYLNITEPSNCCVRPDIFGHNMEKSMDRHTPPWDVWQESSGNNEPIVAHSKSYNTISLSLTQTEHNARSPVNLCQVSILTQSIISRKPHVPW